MNAVKKKKFLILKEQNLKINSNQICIKKQNNLIKNRNKPIM